MDNSMICKLEAEIEEYEKQIKKLEAVIEYLHRDMDSLRMRCKPGIEKYFDRKSYEMVTIVGCNEEVRDANALRTENELLKQRISELENENKQLKHNIDKMATSKSEWIDRAVEWQQKCEKLESKETESLDEVPDSITIDGYKCKIIKTESGLYISRDEIYSIIDKGKEPLKQKCKELEDRHQSDCIEINRLNTTIDVLIHKVEYLRQFAGLE